MVDQKHFVLDSQAGDRMCSSQGESSHCLSSAIRRSGSKRPRGIRAVAEHLRRFDGPRRRTFKQLFLCEVLDQVAGGDDADGGVAV